MDEISAIWKQAKFWSKQFKRLNFNIIVFSNVVTFITEDRVLNINWPRKSNGWNFLRDKWNQIKLFLLIRFTFKSFSLNLLLLNRKFTWNFKLIVITENTGSLPTHYFWKVSSAKEIFLFCNLTVIFGTSELNYFLILEMPPLLTMDNARS